MAHGERDVACSSKDCSVEENCLLSASRRAHQRDGSRARYTNRRKSAHVAAAVRFRMRAAQETCRGERVVKWAACRTDAMYRSSLGRRNVRRRAREKRVTRDGFGWPREQERTSSDGSRAGTRSIATLVHAEWRRGQGRSNEAARPSLDQLGPGSPAIII